MFVQYTNPAGYPPLQHAARILADDDWTVLFLGTGAAGAADALELPEHPNISVRKMPYAPPGAAQKIHYMRFAGGAIAELATASWCYASDLWSAPIARAAAGMGVPVVFHEHDTPPDRGSAVTRLSLRARSAVARKASICVLPSEERRRSFAERFPEARTITVMNCPARQEAMQARDLGGSGEFRIYYHGSIVPERVPLTLFDALALLNPEVTLELVGYETAGHPNYVESLLRRARALGLEGRVRSAGILPRAESLTRMKGAHLGLALVPVEDGSFDLRTMVGASNKPFEYLAGGVPLLVSDTPSWREFFVEPGYAMACDPRSAESIAGAIRPLYEQSQIGVRMGEAGRQRVLDEWNYERQFEPVRALIASEAR